MKPLPTSTSSSFTARPIRVMLVDDSAIVRGLMTRALQSDRDIEIAASVVNGLMAIAELKKTPVDVIILDIEMPEMDGLTALPKLLEISPATKVIMASTLTLRNADISMRALTMGASDYVPKPSSRNNKEEVDGFYQELINKIKVLGRPSGVRMPLSAPPSATPAVKTMVTVTIAGEVKRTPLAPMTLRPKAEITLPTGVQYPKVAIKALAIGSSTGGPQALLQLFQKLKGALVNIPIFITQHMPPTFTTILAQHIGQNSGKQCSEAKDKELVEANHIYVAPGDYHMVVEQADNKIYTRINQNPPVNFCRPAVDPMLQSMVKVYGAHILTVILTGMGQDGLVGARAVVQAGGTVAAQDEATSVVWGMPRAVAENNLCSAVLPLNDIAAYILKSCEQKP